MPSLKAAPAQLWRFKQAIVDRGWNTYAERWLIEASKILKPDLDWEQTQQLAVSIGSWKRFLNGTPIRSEVYIAFCQVLELDWQETITPANGSINATNPHHHCAWGEIPDTSMFVSRSAEIATLKHWITIDSPSEQLSRRFTSFKG